MKKSRFTDSQIIDALKRAEAGLSVPDLCRGRGGGSCKKVVKPSRRREMAQRAVQQRGLSIRAACQAFRISQACYRYEARRDTEDEEIANRILAIDYDNFKNSVEDHDLHAAYARVWGIMYALQQGS